MLKNFFKKKESKSTNNENILILALLIHAAKIDENYTENEKIIIKKVIMDLNKVNSDQADELINLAEKKPCPTKPIIIPIKFLSINLLLY